MFITLRWERMQRHLVEQYPHIAPLKLVLGKAKWRKAKNIEKKDAFGIALMKHSGQVKEALCKWKYDDIDV